MLQNKLLRLIDCCLATLQHTIYWKDALLRKPKESVFSFRQFTDVDDTLPDSVAHKGKTIVNDI